MDNEEMKFKELLQSSKKILVLTGAGISAESGIPTFRGANGLWRRYEPQTLARPEAMNKDPSLVWEFYHYRREICLKAEPNIGHYSLAKFEKKCQETGKEFALVTQNVDGLHTKAGSMNVFQFHGSLFRVRCTKCGDETDNYDSPICEALRDRGSPDEHSASSKNPIPINDLPQCGKCKGLLRPGVVWFGEKIPSGLLTATDEWSDSCDLCIVAGSSNIVHPAASYPFHISRRGVPVAEFNIEATPVSSSATFFFKGSCAETLPRLFD